MKTFKMISLSLVKEDEIIDFPLVDGILINQENDTQSWVLEMLIDQSFKPTFDEMQESGEIYDVKVVISYPGNEPATFQVNIHGMKIIENYISVLMKGKLKRVRRKYAELLLAELLADGMEGEELLERFESDMRTRPQLRKDKAEQ